MPAFDIVFEIKGLHAKSLWRPSLTMVFAARTIEGQSNIRKSGHRNQIFSGQEPDRAFFVTSLTLCPNLWIQLRKPSRECVLRPGLPGFFRGGVPPLFFLTGCTPAGTAER